MSTNMEPSYVVDDEGSTFIAATQRPDGTWRKPRRVKDGYVPQEEVPLYESKGKIIEKNKPKYPVGLSEEYVKEAQMRREAELKRQQKQSQQSVPGSSSANGKKKKKKKSAADKKEKAPIAEDLLESPAYSSMEPARAKDDEWTVVGKSKTSSQNTISTNVTSTKTRKETPSEKQPKTSSKPQQPKSQPGESTDPAKRLKNLRKKLREMEQIEEKIASGAKLEKDQLEKLSRKDDVQLEVERLICDFHIS